LTASPSTISHSLRYLDPLAILNSLNATSQEADIDPNLSEDASPASETASAKSGFTAL